MVSTFSEELQQIADEVRDLLDKPSLHPQFEPAQLREAVLAYPKAGGKRLRPALLTWSCCALGGNRDAALHAGLAVELYHTYTLVHDDVLDRDMVRRGHPSAHALMEREGRAQFRLPDAEAAHYGVSMAILAGDCLQSWSILLLATLPALGVDPAVALRLIRRLEGFTGPAIVEGETRDIQLPFIPVGDVSRDDVLRVILTKTSALFAYCGWAGGLIARGHKEEDEEIHALTAFAERMGIAFQLQDDVLGLVGDPSKMGKPVGSDLREGKRTMITALGWARANEEERALLTQVLGNQQAAPDTIAAVTDLLRRLGAIDDTQAMATGYLDEALAHLQTLPPSHEVALMKELAERTVKRSM